MDATGVLGEAWRLYRAHWRHLISISALIYVAIAALTLLLIVLLGNFGALVASVLAIAGVFWLQGALVVAIDDVRDGRADLSIRQTLERVRPRLNTLSLAALLVLIGIFIAAFAIGIGFLLFIIPGLFLLAVFFYFLVQWVLLIPVLMLENRTIVDSLGRSRELVRGHGWSVFGLILLTILVIALASLIIGIALVWLPDKAQGPLTQLVSSALTAPFAALAWTLAYFRLRDLREPAVGPLEEVPV